MFLYQRCFCSRVFVPRLTHFFSCFSQHGESPVEIPDRLFRPESYTGHLEAGTSQHEDILRLVDCWLPGIRRLEKYGRRYVVRRLARHFHVTHAYDEYFTSDSLLICQRSNIYESLIAILAFASADVIKDSELMAMKEKTNRHLRLRELLLENSMEANLVVM